MSNTGAKVALGAAATAAVFGAKEFAHVAPQIASHSAPFVEVAVGKGLATEATGGLNGGTKALRPSDVSASFSTSATSSSRFDPSGSLGTTMKLGKIADALANPNQQFDIFAPRETGKLGPATDVRVSSSQPVVILNNGDLNRSGISSYFSTAEPKLVDDISSLKPPLSKDAVERLVKRDLVKVAESVAKSSDSPASFEVLSGKLKIDSSTTVGGIKIKGGEVNVYAVTGVIAGGVMTCNALVDANFKSCVDAAVKAAVNNFLKNPKATGASVNAD